MHTIASFTQANTALARFIKPPSRPYTLATMKKLMNYLSDPQDRLNVIHVAGTSGKTSTSYYIASLLHEAGHTVGLSVSPHIDTVSERAQINMLPLDEKTYCYELSVFLSLVEDSEISPSYFELLVAFAFWLFAKYEVEYAVIEVGLGGLLDGTNVVNNPHKICVITDIGYDHTEVLGSTIQEIAAQKAGIIHKGNKVYLHNQQAPVIDTVSQTSERIGAELHITPQEHTEFIAKSAHHLPLFQQRNLALASHTVLNILSRDHTSLRHVISAAAATYIPGRMEEVLFQNKRFILDGSHNPQKISAFIRAAQEQNITSAVLLVSFGENKRDTIKESLVLLRTLSSHIILTEFALGQDQPRKAVSVDELSDMAHLAGFTDIQKDADPAQALQRALASEQTTIISTGSFYLLNHIRPVIFPQANE